MASSDAEILRQLQQLVPNLSDDLFADTRTPLSEKVPHSQLRMLVLAVQKLAPHVSAEAMTAHTTGEDVLAWIRGAEDDRSVGPPPRGSYRSQNTTLRPLEPGDIDVLYRATLRPQSAHRWRFRGRTPSPQEFEHVLFGNDVLAQFIVVDVAGDKPVGLVVGYDPDMSAGHCAVAIQRAWEDPRSAGLMFEGVLVLVQYLFDHFTLRKLYLDVPEYNLSLFGSSPGPLLVEEGRLAEHYYFGDRYWDRITFAIYRSTWDTLAEGFRGRWPEGHLRSG